MPRPRRSGGGSNPAASQGKGNSRPPPRATKGKPPPRGNLAATSANQTSKKAGAVAPVRVRKDTSLTSRWGADELDDIPPMRMFSSSRVTQGGYNSRTQTLYVKFRDGTPYEYRGVPSNVWRNFCRSSSPGRFINRVLNSYDYGRSSGF